MLRHRNLCIPDVATTNQRCNSPNCKMCPRMLTDSTITVNGVQFRLSQKVNCNSENCIYYAICLLCEVDNSYFGRTLQKMNNRGSGHRSCFNAEDFEKSALSMHAMEKHSMDCNMNNFAFAIVKRVHPLNLHREEFLHIEQGRTVTMGLNRMKVNH